MFDAIGFDYGTPPVKGAAPPDEGVELNANLQALEGHIMSNHSELGQTLEHYVGDGQRLRFTRSGSGRPLVLMHTLRTQIEYFQDVIPQLAKSFTVYALDLPGHGGSSIDTKAPYDEPYMRKAVQSFIRGQDLKDVVLVGESIGAVLALTAAAELGDRVGAVVASNPYDYDKRYGDGVRRGNFLANFVVFNFWIPIWGAVFAALENAFILTGVLRGGVKDRRNMPFRLVRIFDQAGRRPGYRYVERKMFSGWRSWAEARNLYGRVKAPVLLIQAEHDWSTKEERVRTASALKTAEVMPLAGSGHFAFRERAKTIVDRIRAEFAWKIAPAASTKADRIQA